MTQSSQQPIVFYSKSSCPWARAVRHVLDQNHLTYDERPIDKDRANLAALRRETGQAEQPSLKIGDQWLVDTDAKAVAKHLGLPAPERVRIPA